MTNTNNASSQKPQALVIGINKYEYRGLTNLQVPVVNARYMANRLEKQGKFDVEIHEEITRKYLKKYLTQLFKPKGNSPKMALFYFSGYVVVKDEGIKEVFLTTSDSNSSEDYELGVSLRWLKQLLQESSVEQQIIILDCCYNEEQKLEIDKLIPSYQNGIDRFFLVSFQKQNNIFLHKINGCSYLTNAILNELKLDQENKCIDNKTLIKVLKKKYEKKLKEYGDFKRISFGKKIQILGTKEDNKNNKSKPQLDKNPYKGLAYFDQEEDPEYFYGRQKLTDELLEKVRKNNFLALMGASASGKSSVIRAGLVYQLKLGEQISGSDSWKIAIFEPGICPLQSLAEAFAKDILVDKNSSNTEEEIQSKIAEAKEYLDRGSEGLKDLIRKADTEKVVLVIDQFEEVFTLREDKDEDNEKIEKFFECLLGALKDKDKYKDKYQDKYKYKDNTKICLVLALRIDFFGKCAERDYGGLARKIQQHLVAVRPMDESELEEAIEGPASELGVSVKDKLTEQLIKDVQNEPASLPLLQYTLKKLWQKLQAEYSGKDTDNVILTAKAYRDLDLKRILEKHANRVYKSLQKNEQAVARYIFLKLTYLGDGTGNTRKNILEHKLFETQRYSEELITRVKKKLIDENLIITNQKKVYHDQKVEEVEELNLVHDALIRHWPKLRQWLDEYRLYRQTKEDIENRAKSWNYSRATAFLYTGELLTEAEKFIKDYGDILTLTSLAKDFIEASKNYREQKKIKVRIKEQRKARNIFIGLLLAFLILISFTIGIWRLQRANINQNKRFLLNQSVALISYSKTLFNEKQQFDGLIEALRAAIPLKKQKIPLPENIKPVLRQAIDGVKERNRLEGHKGSIYNVSFSPDGKILATGSLDKTIKLWNAETGKEILQLTGHKGKVYSVIFNPKDKTQLASSSADGTIRLWNLKTNEYKELLGHKGKVYNLNFTDDGKILATGSLDKTIKLWNVETGKEILQLTGHKGKVYSVSFNPKDSTQLASGSADGTVQLWNTKTGESKILSKRDYNVLDVNFSADGKKLASGSTDGTVHIWNFETGEDFTTLNKHKFSVNSVSFSPDSTTLASGSFDNTIKLWDVATGKEITAIAGHKDWVNNVSFNPKDDKKLLASGSADGTIKLWELDKVQSITTLTGHDNWVNSIIFNPQDKTQLASASVDGTIKLWNINTGKKQNIQTLHKRINSVSFSPDGKILASSSASGSIQLWNTQTLEEIKPPLAGHNDWVNGVSFNPKDGTKLASAGNDETIKVWDIKTGETIFERFGRSEFNAVSFSFDGSILAAASFDNTIKLWDAKTGKEKSTLKGHKNKVSSISFSHDCNLLASGSFDNTIKVWNPETGEIKYTLEGHTGKVESVSFSPDCKILASGSADKTIKLWDVQTGKEITTFAEHKSDVITVSFSPDGKILASGSADERIILWRIPNDDEIADSENENLARLISEGCEWARGYLQNNINVPENDKHLCDNIKTQSRLDAAAAAK
ncbi:MAG: hypothetical protein AAF915_05500 [Cyanobacteria bacterium P01_D01_bin.50]